jgi:hypothetical protein
MGFRPHAKLGYTDAMRNKGRFEVLTAVLMKIKVSGMLRRVDW